MSLRFSDRQLTVLDDCVSSEFAALSDRPIGGCALHHESCCHVCSWRCFLLSNCLNIFAAMVSTVGLSASFIEILREHFSFVFDPSYLSHNGSQHRDIDFYEMYSGQGHLNRAVAEALDSLVTHVHRTCHA